MNTEKTCNTCNATKPISDFYKNRGMADGHYGRCKECHKEYCKEYSSSEKGLARKAKLAEAHKSTPAEKECTRCKKVLPALSFPPSRVNKSGLYSSCKECRKEVCSEFRKNNRHKTAEYNNREDVKQRRLERDYLKKYGMSIEDYDSLLEAQERSCRICKTPSPRGQGRFHVDHNHKTGEVRGLLCNHCNTGLGMFRDSASLLTEAASYLKEKGSYGE